MHQQLVPYLEEALERTLSSAAHPEVPPTLLEPIRYALLGAGKRIRPILCILTAEACGAQRAAVLPAALAMEILHNYTLVHDDLPCMDNDLLRRGRPTVHAKYGEAQGVLVGDALQALAFQVFSTLELPMPALRAAMSEFARAAGPAGVIGGQWIDVTTVPPHEAERIAYVHLHKTADLFIASAKIGAIVGTAHEADSATAQMRIECFSDFGRHLGIAFQIADDLLDEEERAQKPKAEREMSCLDIWTLDEAREALAEHTRSALAALDSVRLPVDTLKVLADYLLHRKH